MNEIGKFLILIGAVTVLLGLLLMVIGKIPLIGRLPGDIVIEKRNFVLYLPIGTSILLSILFSLIFYFLSKR
ncbi:hypothetical protein THER_0815 [Thermodesulfovibrio sp. N1]|uniref:DUF2905 domain-containing protein n=1 Tax=unclassified Thermodesulfovibrio TaxID=2645936 RepID=UPI00083A4AC2|nr:MULTISPECIES: DUF2905 domain-containing protein [unclassified Thermodesulfovibrio]MDI1472658.1 DUF2905 domain-containing protein [Thermodesulfovibrio sp. 1176]ODA44423.1 hypothetical protein THER_0815 [Thermodesulfovibrio sp. N1]